MISDFLQLPEDIDQHEENRAKQDAKRLVEDLLGSHLTVSSLNMPAPPSLPATEGSHIEAEKRKRKRESNTASQRRSRERRREEERERRLAAENLVPQGLRLI